MQVQISWLLQKPTDLALHCLQRQGKSGFSRTRVKIIVVLGKDKNKSATYFTHITFLPYSIVWGLYQILLTFQHLSESRFLPGALHRKRKFANMLGFHVKPCRIRWRCWMRVRSPPGPAIFFRGDCFYGHSVPSANSRRVVVSFWQMYLHKYWLTN